MLDVFLCSFVETMLKPCTVVMITKSYGSSAEFQDQGDSIYTSESMSIYQSQPKLEGKGNVHAQYKYIARNTRADHDTLDYK
jgi:hypothetical protein